MAKKIKKGTAVRVGNNKSIPVRYQGRTAFVVGETTSNRGTPQVLVSFGVRRAAPLPLGLRQFTAL